MPSIQQPKKRSFFERLTGSIRMEEDEPTVYTAPLARRPASYARYDEPIDQEEEVIEVQAEEDLQEEPVEAQLAVDLYETNDALIVKTMTAGVKKEDLQISLSRETLTIRGRRDNEARAYQNEYHNQELYWGPFSRVVELPEEIDIEQATATEHHGLVTIRLPKFDKRRQTTLKVQ